MFLCCFLFDLPTRVRLRLTPKGSLSLTALRFAIAYHVGSSSSIDTVAFEIDFDIDTGMVDSMA